MPQCKVWLDNYTGQYYPGQSIEGKVVLDFESETTFRGIKVKVECQEHTNFIASEPYYDENNKQQGTRDSTFRGNNNVFSSEIVLYGAQSGSVSLPLGQHIYPFNFPLPPNIPSTYHCEHGSIQYKLSAVVDRSMAFDYQDQFIFVVFAPVDLNLLRTPGLLEPSSYSDEKTVCCLCCAQGPISMDVELPKRTLAPNETVDVTVRLSNMSNTNVEGVELELKQIITLKATEPSTAEKQLVNVLADLNDVGLGAHGEHTYTFKVQLPPNMPIPNFAQCRLFKVEYIYKVISKLPGVHKNLQINMYPQIGHIPMGQAASGPSSPPVPQVGLYPDMEYVQPSAPPNGYDSKAGQGFSYDQGDPHAAISQPPPPSYDSLNA